MSLQGSSPWPSVQDKCADVAQSADELSSELRDGRFESCRRHRALFEIGGIGGSSGKERRMSDAWVASLNLTVESCGCGASGRRAVLRRLLLEVQVLPSAYDRSRHGAMGRRGSLKNCFLKVRILLPAFAQGLSM